MTLIVGASRVTEKGREKIHRMRFTEGEDALLLELVSMLGMNNWHRIEEHMPTRNARQCRERYMNYICPTLRKGGWTREEDYKLMNIWRRYGAKWSIISKMFVNRSDIDLRNRVSLLKRVGLADCLYENEQDVGASESLKREKPRNADDNAVVVKSEICNSSSDTNGELWLLFDGDDKL